MKEVVKTEVLKLLDAKIIYHISNSKWLSFTQIVPKKSGIIVVKNEKCELIPTRITSSWHMCIDYRKLNEATRKYHFPLPFFDQILERVAGHPYYCFLDGYSNLKTKKKSHLHVPLELLHLKECHLDFVMLLQHFKYAC